MALNLLKERCFRKQRALMEGFSMKDSDAVAMVVSIFLLKIIKL
jgi:hypothetical protein